MAGGAHELDSHDEREKLTDGKKTPYQLARGSKFNREGLPFAEAVFYKMNAGQMGEWHISGICERFL